MTEKKENFRNLDQRVKVTVFPTYVVFMHFELRPNAEYRNPIYIF